MNLVPSMLPVYLITDLLINYGLLDILYKVFKSNTIFLIFVSLLSGSPSNAKYISEFYNNGYISLTTSNFLLMFAYSPNPLFVLGIAPSIKVGIMILLYIYMTNFLIFIVFRNKFNNKIKGFQKTIIEKPFSECLEESIFKSFRVLILILGVVIFYGIVNTLLSVLNIESVLLSSILEMTNGILIINKNGSNVLWLMFACGFAGLSIHTQIKSILEDTEISYKYFLLGRILACIPILIFIVLSFY